MTAEAHLGSIDFMFTTALNFRQSIHDDPFIAFHGSWNRAPMPQDGYNVTFQASWAESLPENFEIFANGFAGKTIVE